MSTTTTQLQHILKEKVKTRILNTSLEMEETKLYELIDYTNNWFVKYTALKNAGMTIFKEFPTPRIFDIFELITTTRETVFKAIELYELTQLLELFMIYEKESLSIKDYIKNIKYDEYIYKLLKIYEMRNNTDYNDMGIIRLKEIQEKINAL
jgi:hypothetical protein